MVLQLFAQFRIFDFWLFFFLPSANLFNSKLVKAADYFVTGLLADNQVKIENITGYQFLKFWGGECHYIDMKV